MVHAACCQARTLCAVRRLVTPGAVRPGRVDPNQLPLLLLYPWRQADSRVASAAGAELHDRHIGAASAADWPTDSPVVLSSNYRHMLQPPCPDPDDAVLAELLAPLIENIYPALYGLQPAEAGELRLLNQSFVRTDASPEYRPDGAPGELSWPPQGWHMVGRDDPHPNSPSIWLLPVISRLGPASCCRHSSTHSRGPAASRTTRSCRGTMPPARARATGTRCWRSTTPRPAPPTSASPEAPTPR